jgi:hypothetical protein
VANSRCFRFFFLGFAHSGHSLIGAIIDAHPDACVANEANIFRYLGLNPKMTRIQAIRYVLGAAILNGTDHGWFNTGYSYRVKNSWQGFLREPKVFGDKKAGQSSAQIATNPELPNALQCLFPGRLRAVAVLKNPLDLIAASAFRRGEQISKKHVLMFYEKARVVAKFRSNYPDIPILLVSYESFVANFEMELSRLLAFLGLEAETDHIDRARSLIKKVPPRRNITDWPPEILREVSAVLDNESIRSLFVEYWPDRA